MFTRREFLVDVNKRERKLTLVYHTGRLYNEGKRDALEEQIRKLL